MSGVSTKAIALSAATLSTRRSTASSQAFKLFTQVNILTQGGPRGATDTVVHYMFTAGFVDQKVGIASAVSIVLFVFVLTVSVIQRYAVRERA